MDLQLQKLKSQIIILCFVFSFTSASSQSLEYIGLQEQGNVRISQSLFQNSGTYWPKTQVIDSFMYVPTRNGIYRKNLNEIENDTIWDLYAFNGKPIRDFIKKNDSIIGITAKTQDSLMLLSTNNGVSYTNHTASFFFNNYYINTIWRITEHPLEPNTFIALHDAIGVAKTTDLGNNWTALNEWSGGYQDRFVSYHPIDSNAIFYTGEQKFEESYILNSYDNGETWTFSENISSHCTHVIAFHPTNPNILISGGEGRIAKSIDKGQTWVTKAIPSIYIFKIIYDKNNPDILYASGDDSGTSENILIYKSVDGGENWNIFYSEYMENSDGVMDIHLYENNLYVYTLVNGVFRLDLELLNINEEKANKSMLITPNPVENHFKLLTDLQIRTVELYSINGVLVTTYKNTNKVYNTDDLNSGIYFVKIKTKKGLEHTYKLVKK